MCVRRGLGRQLSSLCWSSTLLVQATISLLMVDCHPDLHRTFRLCLFVHAKLAARHFPAKLEQNGGLETRLVVVQMPTQLSYDARGRCCYKRTIAGMCAQLEAHDWPEKRSLQQITIDTYTRVHTRAHAWHVSNTGFTCQQHCTCLRHLGRHCQFNAWIAITMKLESLFIQWLLTLKAHHIYINDYPHPRCVSQL